jgi:PAS domain S-box-containing protein
VALIQIVADIFANAVERRRAHLLLQRREMYFRSLIEHGSDIITVVVGGEITYCSPSIERVLGYTPEELVRGGAGVLCHPDDLPRMNEVLWKVADDAGSLRSVDVRALHKDGTWKTVEILAKPLLGTERSGFIINARDVTHRKELERLKDDLVSTVSHELRTPLTSLRGFVELLLKRDFDRERQREFLGIVHEETLRLSRLIDDFLDIQRIESGRERYDFRPLSPTELVEENVALFAQNGGDRKWVLELDEPLPSVWADWDRIRQVLSNLLSNAVKFSPDGSAIRAGAREGGDEVVFWVADQGIGIPQASLPRLFQKFSRVDNQETRRIGGTGLGLVLVKEIVAAHQGRVWVETQEGVGSSFFFSLPIAVAPNVQTVDAIQTTCVEEGKHAAVQ